MPQKIKITGAAYFETRLIGASAGWHKELPKATW
jgi:hypothetical protein